MKSNNLIVTIIVGIFGMASLGAIILLSMYDHVVPNEISALPSVALGGLLGVLVVKDRWTENE